MGKQKTTSTQSNQFQYMKPPDNPYFKSAEQLIGGYDGGASAVRESHARNINDINESGNEFFGANTPDYVRDKVRQSRLFRNNLELGRGLAGAKQDEIAYKNAGYMSLGGATAPQLVQTGGTSTGTMQDSGINNAMKIVQMGGAVAGA